MKKIIFIAAFAALFSINAFAHEAFTLVSSEKKTVTEAELTGLQKTASVGKENGTTLTFTDKGVRLVVITGPEDDMLSYRIQGVRNPTLVVPAGATLRILFVNVDGDMRHDLRLGHVMGDFAANPPTAETAGSDKLAAKAENGSMSAEELVLRSNEDGMYKYFCSVGSHAKGGMWGNIAVGVTPGKNMKMPQKTRHVHSPDEDKMDMPGMKPGEKMPEKKAGEVSDMPGMKTDEKMAGMDHGHMNMKMSSVSNIGDPMERESSGTAWAPDSSPMYAKMKMNEDGSMWMFMGTAFVRYTRIGSTRDVSVAGKGDRDKFDAPTMFMAMYSRPIGEKSQFGFRGMASLDPVIERGFGYPLLYQSGEQYKGLPLHDRQHPHDFISELAVTFSHKFNDKQSFYLYAGYPGEPALGPPMYLHRISGMNIPDAPIGHHWQDATHITFGVLTAGYSFGKAKFEASAFNGTEPNENRWNFDKPRLNSFSGRFSFNPTKNWAFQISHGYLKNPEPLEPEIRILRKTTASAIYNKKFDDEHNFAGTFVWGQNYANGDRTNAFLWEANYDFFKNAVFGRAETVQKNGHDLVLPTPFDEHDIFRLNIFSVGYMRDLVKDKGIDVGLGGMFTANFNPASLTPVYGGTSHGGFSIFLRFRPSEHN
jgi:plastocyanin